MFTKTKRLSIFLNFDFVFLLQAITQNPQNMCVQYRSYIVMYQLCRLLTCINVECCFLFFVQFQIQFILNQFTELCAALNVFNFLFCVSRYALFVFIKFLCVCDKSCQVFRQCCFKRANFFCFLSPVVVHLGQQIQKPMVFLQQCLCYCLLFVCVIGIMYFFVFCLL